MCLCGCGRPRGTWEQGSRSGYAWACYSRWIEAGQPAGGPPSPRRSGGRGAQGRMEDYRFLLDQGLTPAQAALRMGLCRRTIRRYDAALNDRSAA